MDTPLALEKVLTLDPTHVMPGNKVELFGHVDLVEAYAVPNYHGCHALIALRDVPGKMVVVMTTETRLQSLLEVALETKSLMAFIGEKLDNPPTPLGGTWAFDVYSLYAVILYNAN